MIRINDLCKTYITKSSSDVMALNNVNISFPNNGLVFILGPSGSGKSTLLNLLGGIDTPTSGDIYYNQKHVGKDISLEKYRKNIVGFVFQEYNLLSELDVYHNIALSISNDGKKRNEKVKSILNEVGLSGYEKRKVNELSGGQKQRVAIARSLAKNSKVLLCDEPTGNLDTKTSNEIFALLKEISQQQLVIVVTHNEELAYKYSDSIIKIIDGEIVENNIMLEEGCVYLETKNHATVSTILKCSLVNLFSSKIKTIISFILVTLSLISSCFMVLCLTYDSEAIIANSIFDDSIYLMKNSSPIDGIGNINDNNSIEDISNIVSKNIYTEKYLSNIGGIYIINDYNLSILDNHSFYSKIDLTTGKAYITDYYLDRVVNKEYEYQKIEYSNYDEVINQKVIYNGQELFSIAGIIKTNYKDYYDINSNNPPAKEYYDDKKFDFEDDRYCFTNDIFNICYMDLETFNGIDIPIYSFSFNSSEDDIIELSSNSRKCSLDSLNLDFIIDKEIEFFTSDGTFAVSANPDSYIVHKLVELDENDVVISSDLYEVLFDVSVDWDRIFYDAIQGIANDNILPYIGSSISIKTKSNGYILDKNVKVVGVDAKYNVESDKKYYSFLGNKDTFNANNEVLFKKTTIELDWKNINNKREVLENLRTDNMLVHSKAASKIYLAESNYESTGITFVCLSIPLILISIFAIINLIHTKINDKKREIGILYGIGFSKFEIFLMFFIPMFILMLLSSIITFAGIKLIIIGINKSMLVRPYDFIEYFSINMESLLLIFVMNIILLLSSIIPFLIYLKNKPIDIIR